MILKKINQLDIMGLSPELEQIYERLVTQTLQTDLNEADFTVTLTSDQSGVVIQKYNGTARGGSIPATIQGMPVRQIANEAFSARRNFSLTAIVIPEGVTSIGDSAFKDSGLLSVTIPQSVTNIGRAAFSGNWLGSITLPDNLTTI
ncbi:MAG: leucine-rich repeat domain-containing protein, partial [Treponema sp.]|nr:leucine-rich repeat domain-containing protein [Treponema sp.]